MSNSVQPHRQPPIRLLCLWDSPGKNTGVGCHFLLQCMKVKSESEVTQSCPTLSNPMDCSLPGSSVHGIFQAATEEEKTFAGRLSHEDLYMGNKYMKICLSSLVIREMQIKTTMGYNYIALQSVSQSVSSVTQSCPTLCDPRDGSPRGPPVPGILQARTLEWVAISFSNA